MQELIDEMEEQNRELREAADAPDRKRRNDRKTVQRRVNDADRGKVDDEWLFEKEADGLAEYLAGRLELYKEVLTSSVFTGQLAIGSQPDTEQPGGAQIGNCATEGDCTYNVRQAPALESIVESVRPFISGVLNKFLVKNKYRLASGECLSKDALREIGLQYVRAIELHWDQVAIDIFLRCNQSWDEWQTQVNLMCRAWQDGRLIRALFPNGVRFPRMPTKDSLSKKIEAIMQEVGFDAKQGPAATADVKKVLHDRIKRLLFEGKRVSTGEDVKQILVQLIADACQIYKRSKTNLTAFVMKVLFGAAGDTEEDYAARDAGVNSVKNTSLLGVFLGDDKYTDFRHAMLPVLAAIKELQAEGLTVNGQHYKVEFVLGGKCSPTLSHSPLSPHAYNAMVQWKRIAYMYY